MPDQSLSARRAWIEIPAGCWRESRRAVALRKESVDRNINRHCMACMILMVALRKESVDRNALPGKAVTTRGVALRKESVDRNDIRYTTSTRPSSRSPQGERG